MRIKNQHYRTRALFDRAKKHWPASIWIDDGKGVTEKQGFFEQLSLAWDEAENAVFDEPEIDRLSVWALFNCLHELACKRFLSEIKFIELCDIRQARFDYFFRKNLATNGWGAHEEIYEEVNTKHSNLYQPRRSRKYLKGSPYPEWKSKLL